METTQMILYAIIVGSVLTLIFVILREFWTWYWKINKRVEILEQILTELKDLNHKFS